MNVEDKTSISTLHSNLTSNLVERTKKSNETSVFQITDRNDYIESSEPLTLLSVMCRHPRVRSFAYLCGASTPELSCSLTWYQWIAFAWAWTIRIAIILAAVAFAFLIARFSENTFKLSIALDSLYIAQIILLYPLAYDIVFRKTIRKKLILDPWENFTIGKLLNEVYIILAVYIAIMAIGIVINFNCRTICIIQWVDISFFLPVILLEVFIYFAMSFELSHISNLFSKEILKQGPDNILTLRKYNALRELVQNYVSSRWTAFALFLFFFLLSGVELLILVAIRKNRYSWQDQLLALLLFQGKDVILLFMLIWKVCATNDKSLQLTREISESIPNSETLTLYMMQNSQPVIYTIIGVGIYKTDLLVGLFGYCISFLLAFFRSKV